MGWLGVLLTLAAMVAIGLSEWSAVLAFALSSLAANVFYEPPPPKSEWIAMNTEFGYDRKASVPPLIGTLVPIWCQTCGGGPYQYSDNYNGYSWTDGAPNTFATNTTTGLAIYYKFSGFQLTVPADTIRRRLKVYVGAYRAQGKFDASLSDGSATAYSDLSVANDFNGPS